MPLKPTRSAERAALPPTSAAAELPQVGDPLARPSLKPRLRGWLHFGAGPLSLIMGLTLMVITPTEGLRAAVAVYTATTVLLFGVSAAYHLGAGRPKVNAFLRHLDHANIYLFIAGSYTPFAAAMPERGTRWTILGLVWGIALLGLIVRVAWVSAPRWLVVASYIGLGYVALFFLPQMARAFGLGVVGLLAFGGVLYTIGGIVYARKRPNFSPGWFGFHELFHALTIAAYLVQYVAIAMVVLS
ncbi:MAG: PAQR family membrane homeostasis protein TrhA [Candidatus Nanopelagicales bacterium]